MQAAQQRTQSIAEEIERRTIALSDAQLRYTEARAALENFEAELEESDAPIAALDGAYQDAQARQAAAEKARDELKDHLHSLEQERAGLDARVSALSRALDQRDASATVLAESPAGVKGRVSDFVRAQEGFEAAIGAALGVYADALLTETQQAAGQVVDSARARDLGRLRAVVARGSESDVDAPVIEGLTRAVDALKKAPEGVRGLLARTYIAETIADAVAASKQLNTLYPSETYTIVTSTGDVLTKHTITGGSGLAPSRIELSAELEQAQLRRTKLEDEIVDAEVQLNELREAASLAKHNAEGAFAQLRSADAQLAEIAEQRNRFTVQLEASYAESARAEQALAEVSETESDAATELAQAEAALAEANARPRPIFDASERDEAFAELEHARQVELDARLALETARERARAADDRHKLIVEQRAAEHKAAEQAALRAVLRAQQVERAEKVAQALPNILEACDRSLSQARVEQHTAEQQRAKHSQELTLLRSEEADLREQLHALTERVHGAELKSYERKMHISTLLERAGNELGLVEDVLIAEYGPDVPILMADEEEPIAFNREEQERRLSKAERQLAELGRINPLALEEFAALEQRHAFLSEQLQDLSKTRADLIAIIADLDAKMQGIFADAFADTQAAFAQVFPVLFPGGSGSIELSDPDNLLTTGIEMNVKPAGKKVERLSLLSGGERSLAAVAWLIAIFQARPSPFYIMDEVEAALDDANLGRLLQVFEGLREHSQLIVITHQKRTMEIADALYGVSMRQDGISAVVGQRISDESEESKVTTR